MATTAANVRVAVTGGVYYAPDGTTLPTDATTALHATFLAGELGYVTEDGITQTIDSDTEQIRAWQNADLVREVQTSHDLKFALSLLETSNNTLEAYYGNFDPGTGTGTVEVKAEAGIRGSWVIHVVDGDAKIRIVIPDGQVVERGDVEYVNGAAVVYPITVTAYPDDNDVKAFIYVVADGVGS